MTRVELIHVYRNTPGSHSTQEIRQFIRDDLAQAKQYALAHPLYRYGGTSIQNTLTLLADLSISHDTSPGEMFHNCYGVMTELWKSQDFSSCGVQYEFVAQVYVDTGH